MKYLAEKILFVKPMEIESSYSSFDRIWTNLKKIISNADGFYSTALYRSIDNNNKFGFVSFSAWDNKASFSNAVKNNIALKYHVGNNNGNGRESGFLYLFKVINHNYVKSGRNGTSQIILNFLNEDAARKDDIFINWKKDNDILLNKNILESSYLCKSVYPYSRFRYVILTYVNNMSGIGSINNVSELIRYQNFKTKESNCSVYTNNFKKILNTV